MPTVQCWTGREARALRLALRLTVRAFAEHLGVAVRAVSKWEAGGESAVLRPDSQAILDTALGQACSDAQRRFESLCRPQAVASNNLSVLPDVRCGADAEIEQFQLGDRQAEAFIMARKSQLVGDMRDGAGALDAARAAGGLARPRSRIMAIARCFSAHGHALQGNELGCLRDFERVRETLGSFDDDPDFLYSLFFGEAYVNVQEAHSLTVLRKYRLAAGELRKSIALVPSVYHRDRGVYLSWGAHAYLGSRDLDQALSLGGQALTIARETVSGRIMAELARLREALPEWPTSPQPRKLHQAITDCIRKCDNPLLESNPMNREKVE